MLMCCLTFSWQSGASKVNLEHEPVWALRKDALLFDKHPSLMDWCMIAPACGRTDAVYIG